MKLRLYLPTKNNEMTQFILKVGIELMKNIVITGGSSGVGLAIAKDLAVDNNLVIVGRNLAKAMHVKKQLGSHVNVVVGDLSQHSGVKAVISGIENLVSHVDVLIHCAGIVPKTATDNINYNLLSHYYLTLGLSDMLHEGRVLIVTGNPLAVKRIPISENQSHALSRAAWLLTHKTLLMYFLAEKLKKQQTTVNSFYPGDVRSNLMPYTQTLQNTEVPVGKYLATSTDVVGITANFFDQQGNPVLLKSNKYQFENAEKIIGRYLEQPI